MSPTSMPSLPFSSSSSGTFPPGFIPPPPIFTSAFNSSLLSPHFPPLSLPGGSDYHGSKYEPKFEAKFEPNLSARHGTLPSPPTIRTTQHQGIVTSASDQLVGKVYNINLSWRMSAQFSNDSNIHGFDQYFILLLIELSWMWVTTLKRTASSRTTTSKDIIGSTSSSTFKKGGIWIKNILPHIILIPFSDINLCDTYK